MKKTSVYLDEGELERLGDIARVEGRSQAEIIRDAIASYQVKRTHDRAFELDGVGEGPGDSISELSEEETLRGFGR